MANEFYNHTTYPIAGSTGSSALLRAELDSVQAGFDKLPTLTGNAGKFAVVNSAGNGVTVSTTLVESGGAVNYSGSTFGWSGNPTHSGNHTFSGSVTFLGSLTLSASALASPPAIGGTTPNTGTFTAVTTTGSGYTFPDGTVQTSAAGNAAFSAYQALSTLSYIGY